MICITNSEEIRTASTTTGDLYTMIYTYRPRDRKVLSICVIDYRNQMVPETAHDRAYAQWHLDHCVGV